MTKPVEKMNKSELLMLTKNNKITVDPNSTNKQMVAAIKAHNASKVVEPVAEPVPEVKAEVKLPDFIENIKGKSAEKSVSKPDIPLEPVDDGIVRVKHNKNGYKTLHMPTGQNVGDWNYFNNAPKKPGVSFQFLNAPMHRIKRMLINNPKLLDHILETLDFYSEFFEKYEKNAKEAMDKRIADTIAMSKAKSESAAEAAKDRAAKLLAAKKREVAELEASLNK